MVVAYRTAARKVVWPLPAFLAKVMSWVPSSAGLILHLQVLLTDCEASSDRIHRGDVVVCAVQRVLHRVQVGLHPERGVGQVSGVRAMLVSSPAFLVME